MGKYYILDPYKYFDGDIVCKGSKQPDGTIILSEYMPQETLHELQVDMQNFDLVAITQEEYFNDYFIPFMRSLDRFVKELIKSRERK